MQENTETQIVLENVRLSFPHLFEAVAFEDGDEEKYSAQILLPKSDKKAYRKIMAAIEHIKQTTGPKKWGGEVSEKRLKLPLRDGDEDRDREEYEDHWFFNASSKNRPGVVDQKLRKIIDDEKIYAGCYVNVDINLFPFSGKAKGIAVGLNNVQFVKDGEKLAGGRSAEAAFGPLKQGPDDDDENDEPVTRKKKRNSFLD